MPDQKEWTLMFFLASDNMLAPSIVTQLKAIKDAGFHHDANVIVQFDPHTEGTPTHIFEVNLLNKLKSGGCNQIGFNPDDPYVRNLIEDKLWGKEKGLDKRSKTIRAEIKDLMAKQKIPYNPPVPEDVTRRKIPKSSKTKVEERRNTERRNEPSPKDSLNSFLRFCAKNYPAKHYMLFILGHGVVVGNDVFLYDEHAEYTSLTLPELGQELTSFNSQIGNDSKLELISFHSCSVSSLEVVFELEGCANYMLASQGPAFVGSWPYRQMLIRLFRDLDQHGSNINVKQMLTRMFRYCMHQSSDFLMAGYSYQLTMCDLTRLAPVKTALTVLAKTLTKSIALPIMNDFIVLSHWKSQSFYQEMYTDLYDFCYCLEARCKAFIDSQPKGSAPKEITDVRKACDDMMYALSNQRSRQEFTTNKNNDDKGMLMCSEFTGPSYQYSKGMSIYFPWTEPSEDSEVLWKYKQYKLTTAFSSKWLTFLTTYFKATRRESLLSEINVPPPISKEIVLQQEIANLISIGDAPYGQYSTLDKTDPRDKTGDDCGCPSIKNFARDTRRRRDRRVQGEQIPVAGLFLNQFWNPEIQQ